MIVVMPYEDDDHAVALANDSDYGLYSYVFCGDTNRAYGIGQQLESGNVGLNVIQPHMEARSAASRCRGRSRSRQVGDRGLQREPVDELDRLTAPVAATRPPQREWVAGAGS